MTSVFVISVDATIVNVALPTLSRELRADTAQLQWNAVTLLVGYIGDAVVGDHRGPRVRHVAGTRASLPLI